MDLLWNGGIGTYVKASSEGNAEVGDAQNNWLRINGNELRCKVVGEGGNLGLTQLGRIEYAQAGGRMNTDFIDNSAGVDCSDHEVNIKILLNQVMRAGELTGDRQEQAVGRDDRRGCCTGFAQQLSADPDHINDGDPDRCPSGCQAALYFRAGKRGHPGP